MCVPLYSSVKRFCSWIGIVNTSLCKHRPGSLSCGHSDGLFVRERSRPNSYLSSSRPWRCKAVAPFLCVISSKWYPTQSSATLKMIDPQVSKCNKFKMLLMPRWTLNTSLACVSVMEKRYWSQSRRKHSKLVLYTYIGPLNHFAFLCNMCNRTVLLVLYNFYLSFYWE